MIPRQAVGRLALHRRLISTYATRGMFYVRRGMVGVQPLTDATVLNQTLLFRLGAVASFPLIGALPQKTVLSTVCQLHDWPDGSTLRSLRPFG